MMQNLVIIMTSLVVSQGYVILNTDHQEKQLHQLKQLLDMEDLNLQQIPKEYLKPFTEEIVPAISALLDNPTQSEDLLARSRKVKKDSEQDTMPSYSLLEPSISFRKTPYASPSRRKRFRKTVPPYFIRSSLIL